MDLNYIFLRQQVERTLAELAQHPAAREAHEEMARQYELEIERMSQGQIVFPWHRGRTVSESRNRSGSS